MVARSLVYDIDDLVFLGHSSAANRFIEVLKGRRKMTFLMRKADHVIVCTPHLEAFVQQHNPKTTDISSTIDTDRYVPVNPYSNDPRLTLGWSGSHSTAEYLHLLDGVLREVAEKIDFRLKVIGDPRFRMDGIEVDAMSPKEAKSAFSASSPLPEGEVARTSSACRSSGRSATTTGGCWTGSRRRHERFRKSVLLFNLVPYLALKIVGSGGCDYVVAGAVQGAMGEFRRILGWSGVESTPQSRLHCWP